MVKRILTSFGWIAGAPLPSSLVFSEFNELNIDAKLDMYPRGVGLSNVKISYGHDEYLYQVLSQSPGVSIPEEGLYAIRFHSLYPWHRENEYENLMDSKDRTMKSWVKLLNEHDLYTKENVPYSPKEMADLLDYYQGLMTKYLPEKLLF